MNDMVSLTKYEYSLLQRIAIMNLTLLGDTKAKVNDDATEMIKLISP